MNNGEGTFPHWANLNGNEIEGILDQLGLMERIRLSKTSRENHELVSGHPMECQSLVIGVKEEEAWWMLRKDEINADRITYIDHAPETLVSHDTQLGKFIPGDFIELAVADAKTLLINRSLRLGNFYIHIEGAPQLKQRFLGALQRMLSSLPAPVNAQTFTYCDGAIDAISMVNILPYIREQRLETLHMTYPPYFGDYRPPLDLEPIQNLVQWKNAKNFHTNCLASPKSCWLDKEVVDVRMVMNNRLVLEILEHVRQSRNAKRIVVVGETEDISPIEELCPPDETEADGTPLYHLSDPQYKLRVKKTDAQIAFIRVDLLAKAE